MLKIRGLMTSDFYKSENYGKKNNYSVCCGGDGEDRTLDLLNAIQALSRHTQKRTPFFHYTINK